MMGSASYLRPPTLTATSNLRFLLWGLEPLFFTGAPFFALDFWELAFVAPLLCESSSSTGKSSNVCAWASLAAAFDLAVG